MASWCIQKMAYTLGTHIHIYTGYTIGCFEYFSWQFWNIKFKFRFTATTFFKTGFIWNQTLVALYLFRAFHIEPMSHFEHLFHCCMPPTSRLVLNWLKVHQAWDCLLSNRWRKVWSFLKMIMMRMKMLMTGGNWLHWLGTHAGPGADWGSALNNRSRESSFCTHPLS